MGLYNAKGLYNKYDKNHKERDKTDYYATPPGETINILRTLNFDPNGLKILEPCAGGGHMYKDIMDYCDEVHTKGTILQATDFHYHQPICDLPIATGEAYDFLSDSYPWTENIDWIIMNPPYATIEPFTIKALEIADKGVIMLARLQFLEGKSRYENILKNAPLSDVYVYVDRIQCWKDGKVPSGSSAQAYAWFVFDKEKYDGESRVHWIRRNS